MGKSKNSIINSIYFRAPLIVKNLFATFYGFNHSNKRNHKRYGKYYKSIHESQFWSEEKIKAVQLRELKEFLIFANKNSPYYKEIFNKHGFKPENLQHLDDLKVLPPLNKEEVRLNADLINCSNYLKNATKTKTSGSTGKPLQLAVSLEALQKAHAYQQLLYSWYGLGYKSRMAKCAGQTVAHLNQKKPPFWVQDYYNNSLYLSSYHLSENNMTHYIKKLSSFNPDIIEGYPSSIYLLAIAQKKLNGNIKPRFIRTGSETLLDYQRQTIEESFQCKVHNFYGSGERCVIGLECSEGNIHIQPLFGYTEYINDKGEPAKPGESAKVLATGFSNYAFPLIRYEIGDVIKLQDYQRCKCGRGGTLASEIIGRTDDYILTSDNRMITRNLPKLFHFDNGVVNAQIIQNDIKTVIIKIQANNSFTETSKINIIKHAKKILGSEMNVVIEMVDEIKKEDSGKYKFIISNIGNNYLENNYTHKA